MSLARANEQNSSEVMIRHEGLDLRIYLSPLNKLLLHEETIPDRVNELRHEFLHGQTVKDPIIIDSDSHVVLDGMHRIAALKELNCVCLPVCAVDYVSPSIRVGAWYRAFSGEPRADRVKSALSASRVAFDAFLFDKASFMDDPKLALLFANGECYKLLTSTLRTFDVLRIAEQCVRELGFALKFETEDDAFQALARNEAQAVMTVPRIDKATVREAALSGRLLPHKVTRHVVPARPLGVDVALRTLTDQNLSIEELNRRFVTGLRARTITRGTSGTIIEGRRYDEETYIFN